MSDEKRVFVLAHPEARRRAMAAVAEAAPGVVVTIKPPKRSLDQNSMFHGICEKMEKARAEWAGKPRTAAQWKTLLVSGHTVATRQEVEIVPGLEGEFLNLRESTADMDKARKSSLIEYALAYAAGLGIDVRASAEALSAA